MVAAGDGQSLLHSYLSGEEVAEGPLDPSAYAQGGNPGVGGSRVALADATDGSFITFDDPEVQFAQTLEGNAIVAPLQPVITDTTQDKGSSNPREVVSTHAKPFIYTVAEGDTIAGIASKFGISTNTVLWANGLDGNDIIKIGDHITILPVTGVLHAVASGDTVLELAQKYNAKPEEIIAYNNLGEDASLSIGQKVIIPEGFLAPRQAPRIVARNIPIDRDAENEQVPPSQQSSGAGFGWPTVSHHLSQYFKNGHTGIDIDNRSRPPVFAVQSGTVEFAGWLGGYGNLIIVNHGGGLSTYYAHLEKFYVSSGTKVTKGEAVGKMGSTGHSTGPHVHFEVRRYGKPVNPLGMY